MVVKLANWLSFTSNSFLTLSANVSLEWFPYYFPYLKQQSVDNFPHTKHIHLYPIRFFPKNITRIRHKLGNTKYIFLVTIWLWRHLSGLERYSNWKHRYKLLKFLLKTPKLYILSHEYQLSYIQVLYTSY